MRGLDMDGNYSPKQNFSPRKVMARFGGPIAVYKILSHMGADLTPKAVKKWIDRGTVPADAIIALHLYERQTGVETSIFDLLEN